MLKESKAIKVMRWTTVIVPTIIMVLDHGLVANIHDTEMFRVLHLGPEHFGEGQSKHFMHIMYSIDAILLILLQIRIEIDHFRLNESEGFINFLKQIIVKAPCRPSQNTDVAEGNEPAPNAEDNSYVIKIGGIRILFVLAIISVLFTVYIITYFSTHSISMSYAILMMYFVNSTLLPWFFVLKHAKIRALSIKVIKKLVYPV